MFRVIFLLEAIDDIESGGTWYFDKQAGLDSKFKDSILATIEKLQSDKIIYSSSYRGLSRVIVKRFPYAVYFRKDMERKEIIIFGILHMKQSRTNLDKRI
jgi:toxin ParE1/3/4